MIKPKNSNAAACEAHFLAIDQSILCQFRWSTLRPCPTTRSRPARTKFKAVFVSLLNSVPIQGSHHRINARDQFTVRVTI